MRSWMAGFLVVAMVFPSVAWAVDYPRALTIGGANCVEDLNACGGIEVWCEGRSGDYARVAGSECKQARESPIPPPAPPAEELGQKEEELPREALTDEVRDIVVGGMKCTEMRGSKGDVEVWCQAPQGLVKMVQVRRGREIELLLPAPTGTSDPTSYGAYGGSYETGMYGQSDVGRAQLLARQNESSGKYFVGGFALGFFLGPLGWLIGGLNSSNSAVVVPAAPANWSPSQQAQFAINYTSEVRSARTSSSIVGGIVGTVTVGFLIYALSSAGDSSH